MDIRLQETTLKNRGFGPVSLDFSPGEIVMMCGRSGSGKSTLCSLLCGRLEPEGGEVVGQEGTQLGYIAHDFENQLVGSTVGEELAIGIRGAQNEPSAEVIRSFFDRFDGRWEQDPHTLSAADQQFLLLASLVSCGARLLVLDECLSHLDPPSARRFLATLEELREQGLTFLVVSHQSFVTEVANRVVVMESGLKSYDGAVAEFSQLFRQRAGLLEEAYSLSERLPQGDGYSYVVRGGDREENLPSGLALAIGGFAGSGKSRALNSLFGLTAWRDWHIPSPPKERALLRQHVGPSFWRSSVQAEIEASLATWDLDSRLKESCLQAIPAEWMERQPQSLSHGQLRLFGAVCLLLQGPKLLFLDQPFQGLDGPLRKALSACLVLHLELGGRVLLTTHDAQIVSQLGHRVAWLSGAGETVWCDTSGQEWETLRKEIAI